MVRKTDFKENPKSDLDLDLGFVKSIIPACKQVAHKDQLGIKPSTLYLSLGMRLTINEFSFAISKEWCGIVTVHSELQTKISNMQQLCDKALQMFQKISESC